MQTAVRAFDPRQTMHRPDFEVFHYHDAKMQEVPLHHHDFYEVYYFLNGRVEYQVEGRSYKLSQDDILLISPRELHRPKVEAEQAYERIVLWINAAYLEKISAEAPGLQQCFETGNNLLPAAHTLAAALVRQLAEEAASEETGSGLSSRGIFFRFMAELMRLAETRTADEQTPQLQPLIAQVLEFIGEHFREAISLDTVASNFFVSKYYLSHLFSSSVGTSMYRYILLKRLQHARTLLLEGAGPGDACRESGFQDYANFYRSFRSVYGINPQDASKQ